MSEKPSATNQPMATFWVDVKTDGAALKARKQGSAELLQASAEMPSSVSDMNLGSGWLSTILLQVRTLTGYSGRKWHLCDLHKSISMNE